MWVWQESFLQVYEAWGCCALILQDEFSAVAQAGAACNLSACKSSKDSNLEANEGEGRTPLFFLRLQQMRAVLLADCASGKDNWT